MADINPAPIKEQMYMPNGSMSQSWAHWFQEVFQVMAGRKQGLVNAANADTVDLFHAAQAPAANKILAAGSDGTMPIEPIWNHTVTGSAVTSVTTNGTVTLDANTHGGYKFEVVIENTSGSASVYSLYFNNDQTATNYYHLGQYSISAAADVYNINDASLIAGTRSLGTGNYAVLTGDITITPVGIVTYHSNGYYYDTTVAALLQHVQVLYKTATVTNLTRIDVVSSVASGIGINSRFRLWRKM